MIVLRSIIAHSQAYVEPRTFDSSEDVNKSVQIFVEVRLSLYASVIYSGTIVRDAIHILKIHISGDAALSQNFVIPRALDDALYVAGFTYHKSIQLNF